jgi:hypothetical protein
MDQLQTLQMTALVCGLALLCGPVAAEEAEPAPEYPFVEGTLDLGLGNDWVFHSDDPGNEINDLFFEGALAARFGLTPVFSINTGLTLEAVEDPQPFRDRFLGDIGLYVDTLNLQADIGKATLIAGKFGPGFGTAWEVTPGIYGADFAEDYELAEQIGFGAAYRFETAGMGTHTLGANIFFADTSVLSDSIFTRRGRLSTADGGAGNTGRLDNFSLTLDGEEFPALPGFSYHLGYRRLSAGLGDARDENGYVAGVVREAEFAGLTLAGNAEAAYFTGFGGSEDNALYLTAGLAIKRGPWHGEVSGTLRRLDLAGGGEQTDRLMQLSAGHEWENGVDLSAGYGYTRVEEIDSHVLGLRLTKSFDF